MGASNDGGVERVTSAQELLTRHAAGESDFCNADLVGANLFNAILIGADFSSADLTGANRIDANLVDADLTSTDRSSDGVFTGWKPPNADVAQAVHDRVVADFEGAGEDGATFQAGLQKLIRASRKKKVEDAASGKGWLQHV
jgi:uncharacterized protein YjbI with pentapeptide repeats